MNDCGECNLCCKVLGVQLTPSEIKREGVWCKHCDIGKKGCLLFEKPERPQTCISFDCLWRQATEKMSLSLRPDKSKVVLVRDKQGAIFACVDPMVPFAWKKFPIAGRLRAMAKKTPLMISIGKQLLRMNADGSTTEITDRASWNRGSARLG